MSRFSLVCLFMLFLLMPLAASANQNPNPIADDFRSTTAAPLNLIGHAGGYMTAFAVDGSYVYGGIGPRLVVVDISSKANPKIVGESPFLPGGLINAVVIIGSHVFVANGEGGLQVVNVSAPANPQLVGGLATQKDARFLLRRDQTLFLVEGNNRVRAIDVSTPTSPQQIGEYTAPNTIVDTDLVGSVLFLAYGANGVSALDVSIPATMAPMGSHVAASYHVSAQGNLAFLDSTDGAAPTSTLTLLNISDPANLQLVNTQSAANTVVDLWLFEQTLYLFHSSCGDDAFCNRYLSKNDLSTPEDIQLLATHSIGSRSRLNDAALAIDGSDIFLSPITSDFQILSQSTLSVQGTLDLWSGERLQVQGDQVFIADRLSGIYELDASDARAPRRVASLPVEKPISDLVLDGPYLSVLSIDSVPKYGEYGYQSYAITIYDLSKTETISYTGAYTWDPYEYDSWPVMVSLSDQLYVWSNWPLLSVSVANPSKPTGVGTIYPVDPSYHHALAVNDRYLLAATPNSLHQADASLANRNYPYFGTTFNNTVPAGSHGVAVYVRGARVFYASHTTIIMLTITGDGKLEEKARFDLGVPLLAITADDKQIYAADDQGYLHVLSYADTSIARDTRYQAPAGLQAIAEENGLIYLLNEVGGLYIYAQPPTNPVYLPLLAGVAFSDPKPAEPTLTARGHMQDFLWLDWVGEGQDIGLPNAALRLEAVEIQLANMPPGATITYQSHLGDYAWQNWVIEGEQSGTTGQSRRMEAIRIRLLDAPDGYSIRYRAYVRDEGWQEWVADGVTAGTTGQSKALEGIQIDLIHP